MLIIAAHSQLLRNLYILHIARLWPALIAMLGLAGYVGLHPLSG